MPRKPKTPPRPPEPGDISATVGANLRRLRLERRLPLEDLAARSDVSRSMLSQIELGRSTPTINVLFKIAKALDRPFAALIADAATGPRILRAPEIKTITSRDGNFVSRALFTFDPRRQGEAYELHLQPGGVRHAEAHSAGTTEYLAVSRGALDLTIGSTDHTISAGDAIVFDADVAHVYRNRGRSELIMFLVMTYRERD